MSVYILCSSGNKVWTQLSLKIPTTNCGESSTVGNSVFFDSLANPAESIVECARYLGSNSEIGNFGQAQENQGIALKAYAMYAAQEIP
jgi:hypothetical protein